MASILIVPGKSFPCREAMLETVYTQILPERKHHVTWLMRSAEVLQPTCTSWNGTRLYLFPAPKGRGARSFVVRRISWLRLLAFVALISWREGFDLIQVRNAVDVALVAWFITRFTSTRFVYQITFPVGEGWIHAARQRQTRMPWLRLALGYTEMAMRNWLMRRADLVLAMSDEMRRQFLAMGVPAERLFAFPMGTECPPAPDAAEMARLRQQLGLDGHPVVIYFGTMSRNLQLDFLVRVAGHVRQRYPEVRWLMVGPGLEGEDVRLQRLAQQAGLADSFIFSGLIPRARVPVYVSLANVSVSPVPPIPLFWVSSPAKLVESLACGCPVAATDIPDQAAVIAASGGGLIAPYDEEAFAAAICRLLCDRDLAARMGHAGKVYVRRHRSYACLADQLERWYDRLLACSTDEAAS